MPNLLLNSTRRLVLILIDILIYIVIFILAVLTIPLTSSAVMLSPLGELFNALIFLATLFGMRLIWGTYNNVWRYSNAKSFLVLILADITGGLLAAIFTRHFTDLYFGIWQSIAIVASFDIATVVARLIYQLNYRRLNTGPDDLNKIDVAIVGAGQLGSLLVDELLSHPTSHYRPVCFIDNRSDKIGSKLHGLRIYDESEDTLSLLKTIPVQEIFIALQYLDAAKARHLYDYYRSTGCKVKIYDFPFRDAATGEVRKRQLRDFSVEDLLFRDSHVIDDKKAASYYSDKVILVTGGGGSIGSELCRQVAKQHPRQLIILDIYENNAYSIQQELARNFGEKLNLAVEIASVRDLARLRFIFKHYRPDVVFHAAAHKHVPLMETSCAEAIKNNVFGTFNTANCAEEYGVKRFILISTDKAVNPTNIMGASKRLCEMLVQCRTNTQTAFAAVRFGNVLGSNGSVIPLFAKQIEQGGPITITDKRIVRYFMTIPEASQLVMEAGAMAQNGELFVLDMGEPVRILDMAENMISLAGLRPYVDIDIKEIGLRPGEKLYEELLIQNEAMVKTGNDLIFVETDRPLSRADVDTKLAVLRQALLDYEDLSTVQTGLNNTRIADSAAVAAALSDRTELLKNALKTVVSTYRDPEEVNTVVSEKVKAIIAEYEQNDAAATDCIMNSGDV